MLRAFLSFHADQALSSVFSPSFPMFQELSLTSYIQGERGLLSGKGTTLPRRGFSVLWLSLHSHGMAFSYYHEDGVGKRGAGEFPDQGLTPTTLLHDITVLAVEVCWAMV